MRIRRALAIVATGAVAATGLALVTGPTAGAIERDPLRLEKGKKITVDYDGIFGSFPATADAEFDTLRDPDGCRSAVWCDTIPVDIVTPKDASISDDIHLDFDLSFVSAAGGDVDFYLWDDGSQLTPDPPYTKYQEIRTSTNAAGPEHISFANPAASRYYLTVVSWLGPIDSYRIIAKMSVEKFSLPFELLAPPPVDTNPFDDGGELPEDLSDPANIPVVEPTPSNTSPTLPVADVELPDSFTEFENPELTLPAGFDAVISDRKKAPPEDPSALAVLLATVVVPAAVLALTGWWVNRRRHQTLF